MYLIIWIYFYKYLSVNCIVYIKSMFIYKSEVVRPKGQNA